MQMPSFGIHSFALPREQLREDAWWPQESPYAFQNFGPHYFYDAEGETDMIEISRRKHFICRNCRWIMQLYNDEVYVLDPQSGWWERPTCCACVILDPSGRPIRDDSEEACLVWHIGHARVCSVDLYSNIFNCFVIDVGSHIELGKIDEIVTLRWLRSLLRHWKGWYRTRKLRCAFPFLPWKSLLSLRCVDRKYASMVKHFSR